MPSKCVKQWSSTSTSNKKGICQPIITYTHPKCSFKKLHVRTTSPLVHIIPGTELKEGG
jgi:hypothetical protein